MKDKVKGIVGWTIVFVSALIFLLLAITGRLGLLAAVAVVPDHVAYTGS